MAVEMNCSIGKKIFLQCSKPQSLIHKEPENLNIDERNIIESVLLGLKEHFVK